MELELVIRQKVTEEKELYIKRVILLDDMKTSPDLEIISTVHKMKDAIKKEMSAAVDEYLKTGATLPANSTDMLMEAVRKSEIN